MRARWTFIILGIVAMTIISVVLSRRSAHSTTVEDAGSAAPGATAGSFSASETAADASFPHAMRDPVKRAEIRRQLLEAMAAAQASARAEAPDPGAATPPPSRGQRQTNDVEEFGRFVTQAIREDFMPMAVACGKDLAARHPDAGGTALVTFELLGDAKIGGVVNESDVDAAESTLHDEPFETCLRESMMAVYFDPPPSGGRATLRFPVSLGRDGKIDENVEDFHLKDRR